MQYIFNLHMPSRFPYHYKRPYARPDAHTKRKKINNGWLVCNSVKNYLFQAFTAVSGSSSAEESCGDINAYWKTLWIPSHLWTESLRDAFLSCNLLYTQSNVAFVCLHQ